MRNVGSLIQLSLDRKTFIDVPSDMFGVWQTQKSALSSARHCSSALARQHSMKSLSLPGVSSQIILPPNVHQQFWQGGVRRGSVQCHSTLNSDAVPHRKNPHTSLMYHCFFVCAPSCFSFLNPLIGLIPHSLACPIIFWNIQGSVSSSCHSNYNNIQHGLWHSSFWKCFRFLSRSSVTHEGCSFFKGICSKLAQNRDNISEGGSSGDGGAGDEGVVVSCASWNDPPRICWIKSLHLDIIVSLLCWELLLPEWDQISGTKNGDLSRLAASPGFIFHGDKLDCVR